MEKTIVIKGTLIKAKREVKEYRGHKGTEKFNLTLANVEELPVEISDAYAESGDKFTPKWVKEFTGFVNLSTKYDVPMVSGNEKYSSIEKAIENGFPFMRAEVGVAVVVKDGAVYPKAVKVYKEGEEYNPFALFD